MNGVNTRDLSFGAAPYSGSPAHLPTRLAHFCVIAILCSSVTVPVITISSSLPWFKIEQLALPLILLIYVWFVLVGWARPIRPNGMFLIGLVYAACVFISLLYGWLFLGHSVIISDFYEIPKAMLPVAFFSLGMEADLGERSLRKILPYFSAAMFLVCLYAWAQWMDLGISHFLANFYSGGSHDEGSLSHYRRVYSTMGNPNILGQLLVWAIAGFGLASLFRVGNGLRNLAMLIACLVALVMTGSRYGIVCACVALILIVILTLKSRSSKTPLIIALSVALPATAATAFAVANSNRATLERFETLQNPLTTDSFRDRVDRLWKDARDEFLLSPVFGHGPAKTIFAGVVTDSEYLDVLKQFGIAGFAVYLGYFVFPLWLLWKGLRHSSTLPPDMETNLRATLWALRLATIMAATALIMNMGMSTFYSAALQGFLWTWFGIGAASARTIQSIHAPCSFVRGVAQGANDDDS